MTQQQLERSLQSIGKECFVRYFEYFNDNHYSNGDLVSFLVQKEGYMESGCKVRVSQSRRIIKEEMVEDALNVIISSKRLDSATLMSAKKILSDFS